MMKREVSNAPALYGVAKFDAVAKRGLSRWCSKGTGGWDWVECLDTANTHSR